MDEPSVMLLLLLAVPHAETSGTGGYSVVEPSGLAPLSLSCHKEGPSTDQYVCTGPRPQFPSDAATCAPALAPCQAGMRV